MHSNGVESTVAITALTDVQHLPCKRIHRSILAYLVLVIHQFRALSAGNGKSSETQGDSRRQVLPLRTDREALDIVNIILYCLYRAAEHWSSVDTVDWEAQWTAIVCYSSYLGCCSEGPVGWIRCLD